MAVADTCKTVPFTYIWIIENFSKLSFDIDLESPLFVVDSLSKVKWCIKIRGHFTFQCSIGTTDFWEDAMSYICIDFSFLAADGSPLISKRTDEYPLRIDMLTKDEFMRRAAKILPNNTLTVRCRMWRRDIEVLNVDICYSRTKLKTYVGSFTWPIEEFSALKSSSTGDSRNLPVNERKVYTLKKKGPFMAFLLYLKRYSNSEELHVDVLLKKSRHNAFFSCELSVIDANGQVVRSQKKETTIYFDFATLQSSPLISKDKLIGNKNLFLPNDTLLLKCSFEAFSGVTSTETEYCTQNVSSLVKEEEEDLYFDDDFRYPSGYEEYFIENEEENDLVHNSVEERRDSNSCKRKCPLKAALRYLHGETTLSDICFRIGTKLFPAHKNILCSRSSVFTKETPDNIIEINDMDENTLHRLLQYMYTDTVKDLQLDIAMDLLKAATDYQLFDLKDKCSDFLISILCVTNVRDIHSLAIKYQSVKLEMAAREFMSGLGEKFKTTRDSKNEKGD